MLGGATLQEVIELLEAGDPERALKTFKRIRSGRVEAMLSILAEVDCPTGGEFLGEVLKDLDYEEKRRLSSRFDGWFLGTLSKRLALGEVINLPCWIKLYELVRSKLSAGSALWGADAEVSPLLLYSDFAGFWKLPDGRIILNGRYKTVFLDGYGNPLDYVPETTFIPCRRLMKVIWHDEYIIDYDLRKGRITGGLRVDVRPFFSHVTCDRNGVLYMMGWRSSEYSDIPQILLLLALKERPRAFRLPYNASGLSRTYNGMVASPDGVVVSLRMIRPYTQKIVKISSGKIEWEVDVKAWIEVPIHSTPDGSGFVASIGWGREPVLTVAKFDWDGELLGWRSFKLQRGMDIYGGISVNSRGVIAVSGLYTVDIPVRHSSNWHNYYYYPYVLLLSENLNVIGGYTMEFKNFEPNGIFLEENAVFVGGKVLHDGYGGERYPLWWARVPLEGDEAITEPMELEECGEMPEIRRKVYQRKPLKRVSIDFKVLSMDEIVDVFLIPYRSYCKSKDEAICPRLETLRERFIKKRKIPTYRTVFGSLNFESPEKSNPLAFRNLTEKLRAYMIFKKAVERALVMNALYPEEGLAESPVEAVFFSYRREIRVVERPEKPSDSLRFRIPVGSLPEFIASPLVEHLETRYLTVRLPVRVKSWNDLKHSLEQGGDVVGKH